MTPEEAGFDGCKGIRVPGISPECRFIPERGKTLPSSCAEKDFRERLLWYYPEDATPKLLWCNQNDQWFELIFVPIEKP
jgi:hypothetical protein